MSTTYRVGDKVWVEVDVISVDAADYNRPVQVKLPQVKLPQVKTPTSGVWWPLASTIKRHIPKPREFKPGDKVRHIDTGSSLSERLTVLCIDEGVAWVKDDDGQRWFFESANLRPVD